MKNAVQLITYADRLGTSVSSTRSIIEEAFGSAIGGVHYLPLFTPFDGVDAGFDPVDHTTVDPRLGTWSDIKAVSENHDVMIDVIVNHVSSNSQQFQDFLARGDESEYAEMFLTFDSVFPDGAREADLNRIYRPRPGLPFTPYQVQGRQRLVWTSFTSQQIDIDVKSPAGHAYLLSIIDQLQQAGVSSIRLDAVGYAIKTPGTSCFMTPHTFEFIDDLTALAHARGLEVLVEVHSFYEDQVDIATKVDWVYDFAIPPLLLHAAFTGDVLPLVHWIKIRPNNAVTVLDTHDGIGVIDVGASPSSPDRASRPGLLEAAQIDALVEQIHANTRGESEQATGAAASNLDLYQVNSTYYSALGCNDDAYLLTRAVQFFIPGIPQVYYVGALAGANDLGLLTSTQVGRDINRHYFSPEDIDEALARPVVRALRSLMELRSTHPAFDGDFSFHSDAARPHELILRWVAGAHWAQLDADFRTLGAVLTHSTQDGEPRRVSSLISLAA